MPLTLLLRISSVVFTLLLVSGCGISQVLRVQDHSRIPVAAMAEETIGSRLVFVGEVHDNPDHHQVQLQVVKALYESGAPLAIALEMFTSKSQPYLDGWADGGLSEGYFRKLYKQEWRNVPYELYAGIFDYAREKKIPLIGLNVPPEIVKKVARTGFASLSEGERLSLPENITCDVRPAFRRFMQTVFVGHGNPNFNFEFFCEAQTLWNHGMALNLEKYVEKNPQRQVVVLTGGGHSLRNGGILDYLPKDVQASSTVIIPEINDITAENVTTDLADYLLLGHSILTIDSLLGF